MSHIVHICPRYAPARGGVELFFGKLSEELARRGHHVSVWTTDAVTVQGFTIDRFPRLPLGPEWINGVEVRRFAVRYLPAQRVVRSVANLLPFGDRWKSQTLRWTPWVPSMTRAAGAPRVGVSLVHAAGLPYSSLLFAGSQLAQASGAPLVMSPFTHVPPPGARGALMRRAYLSPLNHRLLSRADGVFVQTAAERQTLADWGLSPDVQTVVGLGVDEADTSGGDRQRFRKAHGIDANVLLIGHLANKSWDKGTHDLIEATDRLWDQRLEFRLVLAGPEMSNFTRRATRLKYPDRVVNLGMLTDAERADFLASIDLFALPSYVESFGVTSLEAALHDVAIVAYRHGGPAALFTDRENARLCPPGDIRALAEALETLLTNARDRERIGRAGAAVARRYSWPAVLSVAIEAYERLFSDTKP